MSVAVFVETLVIQILQQNLSSEKYYQYGGSVNTIRQCVERNNGMGKKVIEIIINIMKYEIDKSKKELAINYIKQQLSESELDYFNKNPNNLKQVLNFIAKKLKPKNNISSVTKINYNECINSNKSSFYINLNEKTVDIKLDENDLFFKREKIVKSYMKNPNNDLIFDYTKDLLNNFETISNSQFSKELMRFKLFFCYMLINTGTLENINFSKNILENIIKNTLENLDKDINFPNIYEKAIWLYSISHRLSKNSHKAFDICEKSIKTLKIMQREHLILTRELFVISNDIEYINEIKKENMLFKYDIIEEFHLKRRLFEFHLYKKDIVKSKELYSTISSLFNIIKNRLDKIYIYMFYKDVYFFFKLSNNNEMSKIYYNLALNGFKQYGFLGQLKKLENFILYA